MDEDIQALLEQQRWAEAFDLIAKRYRTKVFHLAISMLGSRELAEDTTQEAFIRIWKALPGYKGMASVSTWVFAVARNACLTALKSAKTHQTVSWEAARIRNAADCAGEAGGGSHTPDLEYLISQLPEKQRQVLMLFYMEEKSYEEVARLLNMPMGTVKTHLHRARKELALRLRKETANAVRVL